VRGGEAVASAVGEVSGPAEFDSGDSVVGRVRAGGGWSRSSPRPWGVGVQVRFQGRGELRDQPRRRADDEPPAPAPPDSSCLSGARGTARPAQTAPQTTDYLPRHPLPRTAPPTPAPSPAPPPAGEPCPMPPPPGPPSRLSPPRTRPDGPRPPPSACPPGRPPHTGPADNARAGRGSCSGPCCRWRTRRPPGPTAPRRPAVRGSRAAGGGTSRGSGTPRSRPPWPRRRPGGGWSGGRGRPRCRPRPRGPGPSRFPRSRGPPPGGTPPCRGVRVPGGPG
jgi:hypothetical protein